MGSYDVHIQQLHSGSQCAQQQAVAALSVLPLTPRNWLSAVGAIPRLLQLLRSSSTPVPQALAIQDLLHHISNFHEGGGDETAPDGVIPLLMSMLLRRDDLYARVVAARVLSSFAWHAGNHLKIIEAGAIGPLIQLLKSDSEPLQHPAVRTLFLLAEEDRGVAGILTDDAIGPLLQLLRSSALGVQLSAAEVVRVIARENTVKVAAAGAIPILVQLLKSSSNADVQREATQILGNLAGNLNIIAKVVAAGAIPVLVGILKTSGPSTERLRRESALALGRLAFRAQSDIIAAGAIEPLVSLLKSDSEDSQSDALFALLSLSFDNEAVQAEIVAAGAAAPVVRVLRRTTISELSQARAAMVLANVASHDAVPVVKAGAISLLIACLTASMTETQEHAAFALETISNDSNTHAEVLAAAPILPLVRGGGPEARNGGAAAALQCAHLPQAVCGRWRHSLPGTSAQI